MHEMQSQEKEFKLQNQTVMEELSLVCAIVCVAAMLQCLWPNLTCSLFRL